MSRLSFHALKHAYRLRHRNLKRVQERLPTGYRIGPRGRIDYLRNSVTNLFRHERVEGTWDYLDETRGYAEILIQQSIKNGYDHEITKEMVDYWIVVGFLIFRAKRKTFHSVFPIFLQEKDIIPKLFEVLVPRYENYDSSFTSLHTLPYVYPGGPKKLGVLELKGNYTQKRNLKFYLHKYVNLFKKITQQLETNNTCSSRKSLATNKNSPTGS